MKKVSFVIIDTVRSIHSSKIYKKVPRHGEKFWIIKCTENTVRVFQSELADQQFIEMLEKKTIIGKRIRFGCQTFWNHVVEIKTLNSE